MLEVGLIYQVVAPACFCFVRPLMHVRFLSSFLNRSGQSTSAFVRSATHRLIRRPRPLFSSARVQNKTNKRIPGTYEHIRHQVYNEKVVCLTCYYDDCIAPFIPVPSFEVGAGTFTLVVDRRPPIYTLHPLFAESTMVYLFFCILDTSISCR